MTYLKSLSLALLALPAMAHALSASACGGSDLSGNPSFGGGSFACGQFSSGGMPDLAGMPPSRPTVDVFIPGNNGVSARVDSRDVLTLANGAYFAAQSHSVNGSNYVELQARPGHLGPFSGIDSSVMAGTRWQDSFRISGGNGQAEVAITVAWPGLIPPPADWHESVWTVNDPAFQSPAWNGNFRLRYQEGTTEALNLPFMESSAHGSFSSALSEYQGNATYRFNVPYDTWIALEGSLIVSAVNMDKSFAGGVSITGMMLPDGAELVTQSGMPLFNIETPPVPEPETWAMLLAGLGIVGVAARRRAAARA